MLKDLVLKDLDEDEPETPRPPAPDLFRPFVEDPPAAEDLPALEDPPRPAPAPPAGPPARPEPARRSIFRRFRG